MTAVITFKEGAFVDYFGLGEHDWWVVFIGFLLFLVLLKLLHHICEGQDGRREAHIPDLIEQIYGISIHLDVLYYFKQPSFIPGQAYIFY